MRPGRSSRFSVASAFTSKSSKGRDAARSCDGCAAVEDEVEALLREEALDAVAVADVEAVVLEPARLPQQPLEVPGRVPVLAEELAAHVVVDAVDGPAALVEKRTASDPMSPLDPVTSAVFDM